MTAILRFFELIDRTVKKGKITAQKLYGLEGWVSHHNIDIWGNSDPVGNMHRMAVRASMLCGQ